MSSQRIKNTFIYLLGILSLATLMIQCTKDNVNVVNIQRNVVNPDSTLYASFYDSVIVDKADPTKPRINDIIITNGIQSIVRTNCASAACHGEKVKPILTNYAQIMTMVTPGNPEGSKLYQLVTTSNVSKAMPPVNYGVDLSVTDKTKIYNWILNGAGEKPSLLDIRPAAISMLINGCGSATCHNQATVGGEWSRKSLVPIVAGDTVNYEYIGPPPVPPATTQRYKNIAQLKEPKLSQVWNAYKDSVRKFYADTLANAGFRMYKTMGTPTTSQSSRGPLTTYDDIIMDIMYPKGIRSNSGVVYTDANGKKFYVRGDHYNTSSLFLYYIDSTINSANLRTKVFGTSVNGAMAWDDGGLSPSEVALAKAWYFMDPNIPDTWKYGLDGNGIFRYAATKNVIRK